jgi:hypothetical protein
MSAYPEESVYPDALLTGEHGAYSPSDSPLAKMGIGEQSYELNGLPPWIWI